MYFKTADKIDPKTYGKIISSNHYERLKGLVNDALEKGARIDFGGEFDDKNQTISPVSYTHLDVYKRQVIIGFL